MKKILTNLTAAISAAAMLAAPMLTCSAANNAATKDYTETVNGTTYYHRVIWQDIASRPDTHHDVLVGDANGDGKISMSDAVAILQYVANPTKYNISNKYNRCAADVDGNGVIDSRDAQLVQYFDAKMINHFGGYQVYFANYFTAAGSQESSSAYRLYYTESTGAFNVVLVGDANGTKSVTMSDAVAILQYVANPSKYPLTNTNKLAADVNNDGKISDADATLIQKFNARLIADFE